MIDRDPVEAGLEIASHVRHEIAREGTEIAEIRGVLRAHDQPEVMPVVFAARGEGIAIGGVAARIEHARVAAVTGHAFPLEIGDMTRQRRGAKPRALVADDARHDRDAPGARLTAHRRHGPPAPSMRAGPAASAAARPRAGVARPRGLLCAPA